MLFIIILPKPTSLNYVKHVRDIVQMYDESERLSNNLAQVKLADYQHCPHPQKNKCNYRSRIIRVLLAK